MAGKLKTADMSIANELRTPQTFVVYALNPDTQEAGIPGLEKPVVFVAGKAIIPAGLCPFFADEQLYRLELNES